ncbi:TRAP transporter small permease [Ectopseudomonas khazarica]|uniref:TRAP transporter small permease protein n=1 Tax=Ectopseudomonas khazarica TaxID=2502979 RepID=A0ABW7MC50_9GAMM
MHRFLDAFSRHLGTLTTLLGCLCALIMVLSLIAGVFYRYVLNASLAWTDEVALLAFSWSVFLFSSELVRQQSHVRITLLVERLAPPLRSLIERLSLLLVATFGALMLWAGWKFAAFTAHQVSAALRYPLWLQSAAIPVSGALIVLHSLPLLLQPSSPPAQGATP